MKHNKFRYLLTLVALFAMTTGAWAEETATITLKCGSTVKTYEDATLPWTTTADILKAVVTDMNFNIAIQAISGGDGKVVKYGNENFKVTGTFSGEATVTVTYNTGSSATITVTAPAPLIVLDADKKVATMAAMPAFDATVSYELVRDMTQGFSFKVGSEGQDGFTIRVKKDGESYVPSEMTMQEMIALITATDNLDAQNPVTLTNKVDYTVEMFAADADGKPTGDAIAFAALTPGTYVAVATGIGSYDGTALSNTFILAEAYDLTLSPAQHDKLESVKVGGTAATPDENGVIKNIEPGKKVTITTTGPDYIIRKAVVKKGGAATPEGPTLLAQTLTTANMTVKVYFTYSSTNNTCEFLSNGDGTYTFQSGTGLVGGNNGKAKALVVENGKLVFKQNFYETIVKLWAQVGFAVTFDTSENTYSIWKGNNEEFNPTFSKVEVNGTQIALTQQ